MAPERPLQGGVLRLRVDVGWLSVHVVCMQELWWARRGEVQTYAAGGCCALFFLVWKSCHDRSQSFTLLCQPGQRCPELSPLQFRWNTDGKAWSMFFNDHLSFVCESACSKVLAHASGRSKAMRNEGWAECVMGV